MLSENGNIVVCNKSMYSVIWKYTFRIEVSVTYFIIEKIDQLRLFEEKLGKLHLLATIDILPMAP